MLKVIQQLDVYCGPCVNLKLIVALSVSRQLMLHFKNVTVAMQGVDVDIVTGFNMIKTVKETLQNVSLFGSCMWMHDTPTGETFSDCMTSAKGNILHVLD